MNPFPVTNSTLSATHLGSFLQQTYGLSTATQCHLLRNGINDTYKITDKVTSYVFRIYSLHWRTEKEIREELRLLLLLQEHQVPVSAPLADTNGNFVQTLHAPEGDRFGVLFTYVQGKKEMNYPAATHFHIGGLMAQMHQVTEGLRLERPVYTPQLLLETSFLQLQKFLPADTEEMIFMHTAQQHLLQVLENAATAKLRQGAVHLDIWFDNLHIGENNEVSFFDFDFCGNGWLCLDLAYYVLQVHSTEKDEKECTAKVKSFLEGYTAITPIPAEELRLLPPLGVALYFFYLGVQCSRYDNWSNSFLNEVYLKRYITLLVKKYFDKYN